MKHNESNSTLYIDGADIKEEVAYDDSFLKFKLDKYELKIPILISFSGCKVESLRFQQQTQIREYIIGSGQLSIKFPELIQKPQCGQKFKQFSFEIVESSVSRDKIFSAIAIDEETLLVESDNYGLVGESATIFITVKQAILDETNIGFSIDI